MSIKDPDWRKLSEDLETIAIFDSYDTKATISNCVAVPIITSAIFATGEDGRGKAKEIGEWVRQPPINDPCTKPDTVQTRAGVEPRPIASLHNFFSLIFAGRVFTWKTRKSDT